MDVTPRVYAVILAGGIGSRFWPLSTPERPKQFISLAGNHSLLRQTYDRLRQALPQACIRVVCVSHYVDLVLQHLPDLEREQLILETHTRGTAIATCLSAHLLATESPNDIVAFFPADHFVAGDEAFEASLRAAIELASRANGLVLLGAKPTRPDTGFGYILPGQPASTYPGAFYVAHFTEKPDLQTSQELLNIGCLWNTGILVTPVGTLVEEIQRYAPSIAAAVQTYIAHLSEDDPLAILPPTSLEKSVLEKSERVLVLPSSFTWDDLGTWAALMRLQKQIPGDKTEGNVVRIDVGTACIEAGNRPVVIIGLPNVVVIDHEDAVLICAVDSEGAVQGLPSSGRVAYRSKELG